MTFYVTLVLVLAAVYGLVGLLLSVLVSLTSRAIIERAQPSANELLALRLVPAGGAALLALTVVLPAFLIFEPVHEMEHVGPLLVALAGLAFLTVGFGLRRVWRACTAVRGLSNGSRAVIDRIDVAGQPVNILAVRDPIVAVVGAWPPRIVASKCILAACTSEELSQVIAHEMAHVSAYDNLKLLLLVFTPDPLAWLPIGAALVARWRVAAEREADERAAGRDRHKRLALASALIKVARLSSSPAASLPTLSMPVAVDDLEGRVRGLLAPMQPARRMSRLWGPAGCALLIPAVGVPLYGVIHQLIEALVAFGY